MAKRNVRRRRREQPGSSMFFEEVLDPALWRSMIRDAKPLIAELEKAAPLSPIRQFRTDGLPRTLTEAQIARATNVALRRLPAYLRAAKLPRLTPEQAMEVRRVIPEFLRQSSSRPVFDANAVHRNANFARWKAGLLGDTFYLTVNGVPGMILADVTGAGTVPIGPPTRGGSGGNAEEKSTVAKVAMIVDIVLEAIGIALNFIGIQIPFSEEEHELEGLMRQLLSKKGFREALARMLKSLKNGDVVGFLGFLEFLEGNLDIAEVFAHAFSHLGWLDYILTAAKFLAWLAAQFASGGTALVAELIGMAINIAGLVAKMEDVDKLW